MSLAYLERVVLRSDVVFMYDSVGDSGFGLLRSLPAITLLSFDHFTYPKTWRQLDGSEQYQCADHTHLVLGKEELADVHLCAITNQNYEDHTKYTLAPVISRYADNDRTLFVVADHEGFAPQRGQRELRMQPFVQSLTGYDTVFGHFEEYYNDHGYRFPLTDSKNLFMQDNAILYELVEDEQITLTKELFDVLTDAPYLPLYEAFTKMFSRPDKPGATPLPSTEDINGLGKWIRRRTDMERQPALRIARSLNRAVTDDSRIFDTAALFGAPSNRQVRDALQELEPADNPIDRRYYDHLQSNRV